MFGKQTWRIIKCEDNLSVRVLRAKYARRLHDLKAFKVKTSDSSTWKGIELQALLIEKGTGKNVVNGRLTSFWMDKWLGNVRLWDVRLKEIDTDAVNKKVMDY